MIVLSRATARSFRSVARKCVPGRARGPAPPVTLRQEGGRLTLATDLGEVGLAWSGASAGDPETLVVPMALLDAIDVAGDDAVQVERDCRDQAVARWSDRGVPRSFPCGIVTADRDNPDPAPEMTSSLPREFLTALHEAGRTAAREPTRFALHRVQLRGKKGQVIGTDGKRAYLRSGFKLPFPEDVLVPAVPVFGTKEVAAADEIRVGRTDGSVIVTAGPWTVRLRVDAEGKFPDVAGVLPKNLPTVLTIDPTDAEALVDALPGLPGTGEEPAAVTLAADGGGVVVRAGAESDAVEIRLTRSTVTVDDTAVPINRDDLRRMLALGCRTIRFGDPNKPVVGAGDRLTFAAMPLDASGVAQASATATRLATDETGRVVPVAGAPLQSLDAPDPDVLPLSPLTERTALMKSPPTVPAKPEPNGEALDPLVEAEGLRNALAEVVTRATRLITALRHMKREKRALSSVWQSLKDLNLGA
jgi:hypothetical protein